MKTTVYVVMCEEGANYQGNVFPLRAFFNHGDAQEYVGLRNETDQTNYCYLERVILE